MSTVAGTSNIRERILDTALAVFAAHRFEHATVALIAENANLPEATVWAEFPGGKEEIQNDTIARDLLQIPGPAPCRSFLKTLECRWENRDPGPGAWDALLAFFQERATFAREHADELLLSLKQVVLRHGMFLAALAQVQKRGAIQRFIELVEHFQRAGLLRDDLPPSTMLRVVLSSAMIRAAEIAMGLRGTDPKDDEQEAWRMASMLLEGALRRRINLSDEDWGRLHAQAAARGVSESELISQLLREAEAKVAKGKKPKARKADSKRARVRPSATDGRTR